MEVVTIRPTENLTSSSSECRHKKRQIKLISKNQPQAENAPCQRCLSRGRGRRYWERIKGLTNKTSQFKGLEVLARRSNIISFEKSDIAQIRVPRLARVT